MQALPIAIRAKITGRPPVRTRWAVSLTSVSEIDARTSTPHEDTRATVWRADARLDRPDQQPARARHATGGRAPAASRSRGRGDRPRLRPDAAAVRALRD